MPNRGLLRRQMRQAWADTIRSAYMDQVISSERALQVHLTARLMDIFWEDGVKRRVFIEPMMRLQTGRRVHPDLLICNRSSIIGVVELKYQPKMRPKYEEISRPSSRWRSTAKRSRSKIADSEARTSGRGASR